MVSEGDFSRSFQNAVRYALDSKFKEIQNLKPWSSRRSATKTEFMLIGSRQRLSTLSDTLELSIDNVPIEQVSSVKSLGIYVDENLTWNFHVDKLCKKIASAIEAIKRVKPVCTPINLTQYIQLTSSTPF